MYSFLYSSAAETKPAHIPQPHNLEDPPVKAESTEDLDLSDFDDLWSEIHRGFPGGGRFFQ